MGAAGVLSAPGPVPVPEVRPARIQPASAPVPTPWVGAASVRQMSAPVPVFAGGSCEPVQPFPLFSGGSGEPLQQPLQPPLQPPLLSLTQSLALLLAQSSAQVSAPVGPAPPHPEVSIPAGPASVPAGGSGEPLQLFVPAPALPRLHWGLWLAAPTLRGFHATIIIKQETGEHDIGVEETQTSRSKGTRRSTRERARRHDRRGNLDKHGIKHKEGKQNTRIHKTI